MRKLLLNVLSHARAAANGDIIFTDADGGFVINGHRLIKLFCATVLGHFFVTDHREGIRIAVLLDLISTLQLLR